MPSRTVRRRRNHALARIRALDDLARRAEAARSLTRWRAEAGRRAADLGAPAVWALAAAVQPAAWALDPTGELAADLDRVCAEAVARAGGRHLVGVSRPLADRARVQHAVPRS